MYDSLYSSPDGQKTPTAPENDALAYGIMAYIQPAEVWQVLQPPHASKECVVPQVKTSQIFISRRSILVLPLQQSPRLGNGNDPHDSRASAISTGCTTRCTQNQTIPDPKTPTVPKDESLGFGHEIYYGVDPATAGSPCLAASPFPRKTSCCASSNIPSDYCSSLQSGRMC